MPSTSTLTSSEKSLIKKSLPLLSGEKIHSAAIARVYYAFPSPSKWSYSGLSGALVFGWGPQGGWLKLVDLAGTRGVIWEHRVVEEMPYYQDRTFFHTFPSDVRFSFLLLLFSNALLITRVNTGLHDRSRLLLRIRSLRTVQKALPPSQIRLEVQRRLRQVLLCHQLPEPFLQREEEEGQGHRQEHDRSSDELQPCFSHGIR
jgi:hypothetical protein